LADTFLFDTSVYIAYIRSKAYSDLVDRATESGRVVLSSVVAMELYAGARSAEEKRLLDRFVASMKRMSAYEVPGEEDWARGGVIWWNDSHVSAGTAASGIISATSWWCWLP